MCRVLWSYAGPHNAKGGHRCGVEGLDRWPAQDGLKAWRHTLGRELERHRIDRVVGYAVVASAADSDGCLVGRCYPPCRGRGWFGSRSVWVLRLITEDEDGLNGIAPDAL